MQITINIKLEKPRQPKMDYIKLCQIFRSLALKSGDAIMDVYTSDKFEVLVKSDDSPITLADKKADEIITKGLRKYFPNVPIIPKSKTVPMMCMPHFFS